MKNLQIVVNQISNKIQIYLNRSEPVYGKVRSEGILVHEYSYDPNKWKGGTDYESTLAIAKRHLSTLQTWSDNQIQELINS